MVITDTTKKQDAATLLDTILDQACREAGMSAVEVEQSKRVAAIEERLVASGRSIKDIYREWETKTPEQILEEYKDLFPSTPDHSQVFETDWLPVTFRVLQQKQQTVALFDAQTLLANKTLWQGTIEAIIENRSLVEYLLNFACGEQVQARFSGRRNKAGFVPVLIDVKVE